MPLSTILVLGMHRSGTSVLTAGLEAIGVSLGGKLMPPDESDNAKGYFENPDIVDLNDRLLALDGDHWASLAYGITTDYSQARYDPLRGEARRILETLSGTTATHIALKDPRISLTLPFWMPLIKELIGPEVFGLLSLRHPLAVAASLESRWRLPHWRGVMAGTEGDPRLSILLWLSYTYHSLVHMQGHPLRIVSQDSLVSAPRQELKAIAGDIGLEVDDGRVEQFANEFVDPSLDHHGSPALNIAERFPELAFVDALWETLLSYQGRILSEDDRTRLLEAFPPLDFAYLFARPAALVQARHERARMEQALSETQEENSSLRKALVEERDNVRIWERASEGLKDELRAAHGRLGELEHAERQVVSLTEALHQERDNVRTWERASNELKNEVQDAHAQIHSLTDGLNQEREKVSAWQKTSTELQGELARTRATLSWRLTRPLRDATNLKRRTAQAIRSHFAPRPAPIITLSPTTDALTPSGDPVIEYAVDNLIFAHGRIHGWGWMFSREGDITEILFGSADGGARTKATVGLDRVDVANAFASDQSAEKSGFLLNGIVLGETRTLRIEAFRADREVPVAVLDVDLRHYERKTGRLHASTRLAKAVWRYLSRGDIRGLLNSARRQHAAAHLFQRKTTAEQLLSRLMKDGNRSIAVIDHNLGGGANLFRERVVDNWVAEGKAVLVLYFNLSTLDYVYELHSPQGTENGRIDSLDFLDTASQKGALERILYNNAVSFPDPVAVVDQLASIGTSSHVPIEVAIHDYFPVCPSWTLLDDEGKYCGVPGLSVCENCLSRHDGDAFTLAPKVAIPLWRSAWGNLLAACDRITCYSETSKAILSRAYPTLDPGRVDVKPHVVDYVTRAPKRDRASPKLHVGIVGAINIQKGALIVQALAEKLSELDPEARITLFGRLDGVPARGNVAVTGDYDREELPALIEDAGPSVFLFPSVWPETFSYVTGELMAMKVPIVAFALGAPAERLAHYDNAIVVEEVSADALIPALYALHQANTPSAEPKANSN